MDNPPVTVWLLWFDGHAAAPAVFATERAAKARVADCEGRALEWYGRGIQCAEGRQTWFLRARVVQRESQAVDA
jgi:hypothetical protein